MPAPRRSRAELAGIQHKPLSQDEITAALLDPAVFTSRHCYIRGKGGKQEKFELWPFQHEVINCFDDEERVLVLKARQLGISWLGDAYALWLCTANRGQSVMILSQGQRESQEEMRRIRFMHDRLPPELRRRTGIEVDVHAPDTTTQLEFPDMDSRIVSLPSTEHAGTSFTSTLVIIHELAKIQTAATLIPAITPTMADHGRMFVISTAFGFSGSFYDMWKSNGVRWHTGQVVGDRGERGSFRPIFIPWHARPGRDEGWYKATQRTFDKESMMKQEYPLNPTEAFQGSADAVFTEEFDRHLHGVDGSRSQGSVFEVVHGMDLGVNNAFSYLIEIQGQTAFVFAEIHLQNDTVESLAQATLTTDLAFGLDSMEAVSYVDPAGVARNLQTMQTDYDVIKECGLLVDESSFKVAPSQRVDIMKRMIREGRLWISLDCPLLLDAFEQAQWKQKRGSNGVMIREDTYEKDGKHEHPLDAIGYALSRIYPPMSAAAAETTQPQGPAGGVDSGAVGGSYSGSEFGG